MPVRRRCRLVLQGSQGCSCTPVVQKGRVGPMTSGVSAGTNPGTANAVGSASVSPIAANDAVVIALTKQLAQLEQAVTLLTTTIREQSATVCSQMTALSAQALTLANAMQREASPESSTEDAEEAEIDETLRDMFADDTW